MNCQLNLYFVGHDYSHSTGSKVTLDRFADWLEEDFEVVPPTPRLEDCGDKIIVLGGTMNAVAGEEWLKRCASYLFTPFTPTFQFLASAWVTRFLPRPSAARLLWAPSRRMVPLKCAQLLLVETILCYASWGEIHGC